MQANPLPLKDIHLPAEIGWWPPAPGWWLVAGLLILIALTGYFFIRRVRRKTAVKTARKLLFSLQQNNTLGTQQKLTELSILMRRVAISVQPRQQTASLTGRDWLRYLDSSMPDNPFSEGIGQYLADAHYRPVLEEKPDLAELIRLCENWLKMQKIKL